MQEAWCNACEIEVIERRQAMRLTTAITHDVYGRHVVCYAIYPGTQRAASAECGEAALKRNVNLLQQVLLQVGVNLVGTRKARERRRELCCRFLE
jgi:hypothetical protein